MPAVIDLPNDVVVAAQRGDPAASRQIIEALHRPVIATLFRFLGPAFKHETEDIAQDVFLKVFRAIDRFDPARGVKFTTWVYTFIRNHCFDVLKKRRLKTSSLTSTDPDEAQRDVPDQSSRTAHEHATNTELGERIQVALHSLGEDQRMVFILREYEGLDYSAIASVVGVSEGTVKSRLHRAKEALRQRLEPYLRTGSRS